MRVWHKLFLKINFTSCSFNNASSNICSLGENTTSTTLLESKLSVTYLSFYRNLLKRGSSENHVASNYAQPLNEFKYFLNNMLKNADKAVTQKKIITTIIMLTDSPKPSSKHDCNKSEQNTSFTIDKIVRE